MSKTPQELFAEREKRVQDAMALKVPDRVPVFLSQHFFPARYVGMTYEQAYYDVDKWLAANEKTIVDYEPDVYFMAQAPIAGPGEALEAMGMRQIKWPGHGVPANRSFQFIEGEYMKAEEYDEFLADPSDWTVRKYMPRIYSNLQGLGMLPPITSMLNGYVGSAITGILAIPPVAAAFDALLKGAQVAGRWSMAFAAFDRKMATMGFPEFSAGVALAPFDIISDMLRGMRGAMIDMYRCPDKLIAAQKVILPMQIGGAIGVAHMSGNPRVFIPLHRGADGFMSNEQFEAFYWPGLKALILALIDAGLVPCPFWEGTYDQRLEYLRELPPGKVLGWFDRSNLVQVKEVLGDVLCICGDMPVSLLESGTPEQVVAYSKKLIDTVGKDGGFVMSSNTVLDECDPALVKVWLDFTRAYGVYR